MCTLALRRAGEQVQQTRRNASVHKMSETKAADPGAPTNLHPEQFIKPNTNFVTDLATQDSRQSGFAGTFASVNS